MKSLFIVSEEAEEIDKAGLAKERQVVKQALKNMIKKKPAVADNKKAPPPPAVKTLPPVSGYLQVAYAAGAAPEAPTLELFTTPADEQAADAVWRRLNLPAGDRVVVLNTGGAFGAAKDWPAANFTTRSAPASTASMCPLKTCARCANARAG